MNTATINARVALFSNALYKMMAITTCARHLDLDAVEAIALNTTAATA